MFGDEYLWHMVEGSATRSEMVEGNYFVEFAVEENCFAESAETFERQGLARIARTCRGHTRELLTKVTRGFEAFEPDKGKYYGMML